MPSGLHQLHPESLSDSELRYRELVELSPDAVFILCEGECVFVNAAGVELFGAECAEQLIGKHVLDLMHSEDRSALHARIQALLAGERLPRSEEEFIRFDGTVVDVEIGGSSFTYQGRPAVQIVAHDITERKQAEEHLHYLAYYDGLTGLPNRLLFNDRLTQALMHAERYEQQVAVMMLDIDKFSETNTVYGHAFGDHLLQSVAARIQMWIRECDTVARISSDEFYLLMPNIGGAAGAEASARRLMAELSEPFVVDGHELHLTASMGIALYPADGDSAETLLQNVDMAMYRAKKQGGNACMLFSQEISNALAHKRMIEDHLRRAIDNNEFTVYYQPQIQVSSMSIVGVEALVRWLHPEWGMVSSATFIPVAEDAGLVETLDEIVLRTACQQNRAWQEAGLPRLRVASNLSARQFRRHNLVEVVTRVLDETGLSPDCLELEITESTVMENVDRALPLLNQLRDLGVSIAIDDFGTGYSSLSYLKKFPVNTIKIDRAFVQDLLNDEDGHAIVKAIIGLSHTLNLKVLAEGVEIREQLEFLREHQCDEIQGYLFSKPVPAQDFSSLLKP